jgi:NitT/TauT family transport system substrate-binding protein
MRSPAASAYKARRSVRRLARALLKTFSAFTVWKAPWAASGEDVMANRRIKSARILGIAAALAALCLGTVEGRAEDSKPLKKVRIAVGTSVINIGYPMLTLPVSLGYWKQEGYDVELLPVGASLQAIQQMVAGNADFAEVNSSVIIQSNTKNDLPVRVAMTNGVIDWAIAVDADGPIKSVKDLKGKTIGVFSLATGGIAYMQSYLRANGINPDRDVELVALGLGAPPVQALKTGKVQGLLYWAAAIAAFENAGLKLKKLVGDDWRSYPDYSLSVMAGTAAKDPNLVIGIVRGMAKATVFAFANPDCARKLHWSHFPATKASGAGADEATLIKWDMNTQKGQLDSMVDAFKLGGGKDYGAINVAAYDKLVKFMLEAKQIDKTMPAEKLLVAIPDLTKKANDFDVKAIEADAKACKY